MKTVKEILRDTDPLGHEPPPGDRERDRIRRTVVDATSKGMTVSTTYARAPLAALAAVALIVIGILAVGARTGPHGSATVYAAVRFEVRLAETQPGAGLREVRVSGSDRSIYLHDEVVVTNADIVRCTAISGSDASHYNIGIEFNAAGAEKVRQATLSHEGRPIAVLIDGEVVMAPVLRSPIARSAVISGDYTKAEAERIINGIGVR